MELRSPCGPLQQENRGGGTGGSSEILEAAERFMVEGHEDERQLSRQRRASAVGGVQGSGGGGAAGVVKGNTTKGMRAGGGTAGEGKPRWTTVGRGRLTGWQGTRPTQKWNMYVLLVPLVGVPDANVVFLCHFFFSFRA